MLPLKLTEIADQPVEHPRRWVAQVCNSGAIYRWDQSTKGQIWGAPDAAIWVRRIAKGDPGGYPIQIDVIEIGTNKCLASGTVWNSVGTSDLSVDNPRHDDVDGRILAVPAIYEHGLDGFAEESVGVALLKYCLENPDHVQKFGVIAADLLAPVVDNLFSPMLDGVVDAVAARTAEANAEIAARLAEVKINERLALAETEPDTQIDMDDARPETSAYADEDAEAEEVHVGQSE